MRSLPLALLAVVAATIPLRGQVVRGTITERTSGAPLAGVVVDLVRGDSASASSVASVLTDVSGAYALRAPGAGRYLVSAKRVGVRRFLSPALTLGVGETRTLPIVLDALLYRLPEVVVAASS